MIYKHKYYGMITPAVSLMKDGKVDVKSVFSMMHFLKNSGVKGVFIAGTTGYAPMLTEAEHKDLLKEYTLEADKEHLDTFAGIGRDSIEETMEVGKYAIDIGAKNLVIVTPYYIKEDQEQMHSYYSKLLSGLDANVLIYNIPSMTGNNIDASTVAKLEKENSNLIGVKSTSTDFDQFQKLIYYTEKDFMVFQGYDHLLLPSLEIGASGGVCGTTNFTDLATSMCDAYAKGNYDDCIDMHKAVSEIYHTLEPYEFPEIYNAIFYKLIIGKVNGESSLFSDKINTKEINRLAEEVSKLAIKK